MLQRKRNAYHIKWINLRFWFSWWWLKISSVMCCLVARYQSFCTDHRGAGFLWNVGESHPTRQNQMNWGNWKDPHITLHHGLSGFSVRVLLRFPVFIRGLQYDEGIGSRDVEICAFWDSTQRRVVIAYRRFGTTYPHPMQVSQWVVPKRRYGITTLCRVISQKNAAHIHIAAETWNHDFVVIVQWIKQND
jgi:hypothetical protein